MKFFDSTVIHIHFVSEIFESEIISYQCFIIDPCFKESFGGNSFGHCCHFPFIYKGMTYYKCIHGNKDGANKTRSWCSTTYDYDKDGKWGFCEEEIVTK